MAEEDFYNIKGLGELPEEQEAPKPTKPVKIRVPHSSAQRKHTRKIILIVVGAVILLAAIGGGGYWFMKHHKARQMSTTKPNTATVTPSSTASNSNGTTHYISNGQDLNLEFDYPNGWTVSPPTNSNPNDQAITLNSPSVTILDASGKSVTGKVTFTIRPGTATINELNSNNPTAAQASTQIAYTSPTPDQHDYTYLSFIHFTNGSSAPGAFEEVLVTGIQQFNKGDQVNTSTLSAVDPIIAANFYTCASTACSGTGSGPLSITNDTWQNDSFVRQVQNIFESLKLH